MYVIYMQILDLRCATHFHNTIILLEMPVLLKKKSSPHFGQTIPGVNCSPSSISTPTNSTSIGRNAPSNTVKCIAEMVAGQHYQKEKKIHPHPSLTNFFITGVSNSIGCTAFWLMIRITSAGASFPIGFGFHRVACANVMIFRRNFA